MSKVVITGTGTIAQELAFILDAKGYRVSFLSTSRSYFNKFPCFNWNVDNETIDPEALKEAEYIIHLAGAGIADKKWSNSRKKELIDSRVKSVELLHRTIKQNDIHLKAFITASGSNYYGLSSSDQIISENDPHGDDFIGNLCNDWESAAYEFEEYGSRVVALRTGVVLSKTGGALERLRKLVKNFLGAPIGNGKQIMPWIHIDDLCQMYLHTVENDNVSGSYNAVADQKVYNKYFMHSLGRVMKRPILPIPVPKFVMKMMFGEMAGLLINGYHLSNDKIKETGFNFKYKCLLPAMEDLLSNK